MSSIATWSVSSELSMAPLESKKICPRGLVDALEVLQSAIHLIRLLTRPATDEVIHGEPMVSTEP